MKEWREKSKQTEKWKSCAPGSNVPSSGSSRPVESAPVDKSTNKTIPNATPLVKVSSASFTVRSNHEKTTKIDVRTKTDSESKIVSFARTCEIFHFPPDIEDLWDNTSFCIINFSICFYSRDFVCRQIVHLEVPRACCHHLLLLKTCSMSIASWARR